MNGERRPEVSQANLRGWKRLAAGFLLVPALSALSLDAQAQSGSFAEFSTNSSSPKSGESKPTSSGSFAEYSTKSSEAKATSPELELGRQMMKQAHAAYDKKDLVRAKDLAEQALMLKVPMSAWGDDRPDVLLAEIERRTGVKPNMTASTMNTSQTKAMSSSPSKKPVDPKVLVHDGRVALDAGKLDLAQDLARQAEATKPSSRWGLFEDNPSSLLRDVDKARARKNKADSVQMLAESRMLLQKRANTASERMENLEKAQDLALQAEKLHGPYTLFDLGDRPAKVLSEIDVAKAQLKSTAIARSSSPKTMEPKPSSTMADRGMPSRGEPRSSSDSDSQAVAQLPKSEPTIKPVGYNPSRIAPLPQLDPVPAERVTTKPEEPKKRAELIPLVPPTTEEKPIVLAKQDDTGKVLAKDLMKEANALQLRGDFPAAKAKLLDASKYQLYFTQDEESPDVALRNLGIAAHKQLASLCKEATNLALKGDTDSIADAEKKVKAADELAKGMGIDGQSVVMARSMVASAKNQDASTGAPAQEVTALPPPATNPGLPAVGAPMAEERPTVPAQQMLMQARNELRSGDTDAARRHVEEILANGANEYKEDAQKLLRTIDNEESLQRQRTALKSFDAGIAAYNDKEFRQALAIFQLIDDSVLPANKKAQLKELKVASSASVRVSNPSAMATKPTHDPGVVQAINQEAVGAPSGIAQVGEVRNDADSMLKQQEALTEIQFQKLRSEGLKIQSEAQTRFGKGETDEAIAQLQGYLARVKEAQLESARASLLSRPVENRLEQFKVMKRQQDVLTAEKKERSDFRKEMSQEMLVRQNKEQQVAKLLKEFSALMEAKKYEEAYACASKAKEIDPDNTVAISAVTVAKTAQRSERFKQGKDAQERYNFEAGENDIGINAATSKNPLVLDPDAMRRSQSRPNLSSGIGIVRPVSEKEREIEKKMQGTISINFSNTPLPDAIDYFRTVTGIPISLDRAMIDEDGRDSSKLMVNERLTDIKVRSALNVILKQLKLVYHLEDDVLKITTQKAARGKLTQKIIPVADLIVPIQDFNPAAVNDMTSVLTGLANASRPTIQGVSSGGNLSAVTPYTPANGLGGGVGTPTGTPSSGGRLETNPAGQPSLMKQNPKGTMEQSLIKLITSTIGQGTWSDVGGPGTIDYYPIGMALVINQTPDVIEQIIQLLESLRQLQDLEVAIEIRLIALSEAFFERIGVDFDLNIKTNTRSVEPNITQNAFRQAPFVNDISLRGTTIGLTPAGNFTPDLDIPIRATSLPLAIPPFGGFQNAPGMDGGISFGLAFLNDIQVFMLLEAAQGDRRFNVMQAPKLTMFNGQTATLNVSDLQFFLTSINVISVAGQIVFSPQNQAFPLGVQMTLQPVISGDRRFVRITVNQTMTSLASTNVPLFPITTFVTPVFDTGFTGTPVPFTQFVQQPTISNLTVQTTVSVPDGGTVLLGGLKTLSEGRNEFGPPVLSKIPYLNRLVKNVGYGREAQSLMMMVTPRIIVNRDEEERQTGFTVPPGYFTQ